MPIVIENTPNPNALKFTVGVPVGGPQTYLPGQTTGNELAEGLVTIPGVISCFMTADFVTISKLPDADWTLIAPAAESLLAAHFPS
jgi:hypothetical protein